MLKAMLFLSISRPKLLTAAVSRSPNEMTDQLIMPPWNLRGRGAILLYRRAPESVLESFVPDTLKKRYVGGPAVVMFVDYTAADCGPYRELLFIPGRFRCAGGTFASITRIVVSTQASVVNGREHWAIPKDLADIDLKISGRRQSWQVGANGQAIAGLSLRSIGPPIPISTRLIPRAWASVAQPREDQWLVTALKASGRMRLARVAELSLSGQFPDMSQISPAVAVVVDPFQMVFPDAEVIGK